MKDREIFWSCAQTGLHTTSLSHITLHYKLLMSFRSIATMKCATKWCACPKIVRVSEHLCWGAIGNTLSRKFRKCHSPVIQLSAYFHWSCPALPASHAHLASTHLCTQLPLLTCNQHKLTTPLPCQYQPRLSPILSILSLTRISASILLVHICHFLTDHLLTLFIG